MTIFYERAIFHPRQARAVVLEIGQHLNKMSLPPSGDTIKVQAITEKHSRSQRNKIEAMIRKAGQYFGLSTEYELMQFREVVLAQTAFTEKEEVRIMGVKIMKRISTANFSKREMSDLLCSVRANLQDAGGPEYLLTD